MSFMPLHPNDAKFPLASLLAMLLICVSPVNLLWAQTGTKTTGPQVLAPAAPVNNALGGVPLGSGPGVHSPNSPYKPLVERTDVLSWKLLTDVKTQRIKTRILPAFGPEQLALNQKSQRVQGFMMPLEPGQKQKHFLISSVPLNCSFCLPGGPESMVEVKTKTAIAYTQDAVVVEGQFLVLQDDSYGLYYRMLDAVAVK